jgi:hypothetical protein
MRKNFEKKNSVQNKRLVPTGVFVVADTIPEIYNHKKRQKVKDYGQGEMKM